MLFLSGLPALFVLLTVPLFLHLGQSQEALHSMVYTFFIHYIHLIYPMFAWLLVFVPWGIYGFAYLVENIMHVWFPQFETRPPFFHEQARETEKARDKNQDLQRLKRVHSAPAIVQTASSKGAPHDPPPPETVVEDWQLVGLSASTEKVRKAIASPERRPLNLSKSEPNMVAVPSMLGSPSDDEQSDLA